MRVDKGIVDSSSPNTKMTSLSFSKKLYIHQHALIIHTVQIRKWKRLFTAQLLGSSTDYIYHEDHNLTIEFALLEITDWIDWSNNMVPVYTELSLRFL